jgi:hypothetical protein
MRYFYFAEGGKRDLVIRGYGNALRGTDTDAIVRGLLAALLTPEPVIGKKVIRVTDTEVFFSEPESLDEEASLYGYGLAVTVIRPARNATNPFAPGVPSLAYRFRVTFDGDLSNGVTSGDLLRLFGYEPEDYRIFRISPYFRAGVSGVALPEGTELGPEGTAELLPAEENRDAEIAYAILD